MIWWLQRAQSHCATLVAAEPQTIYPPADAPITADLIGAWRTWPQGYKYTPCVLLPSTVMTLPQI